MSSNLRIGLLIASVLALSLVIVCIVKRKLNIKYSIVWFLWALVSLLMAAFPDLFYAFSKTLGIEIPSNAVFLIMIGLLYALTFYSYVMVSKHNDEIVQLTYSVSVLKKEIEELKRK